MRPLAAGAGSPVDELEHRADQGRERLAALAAVEPSGVAAAGVPELHQPELLEDGVDEDLDLVDRRGATGAELLLRAHRGSPSHPTKA